MSTTCLDGRRLPRRGATAGTPGRPAREQPRRRAGLQVKVSPLGPTSWPTTSGQALAYAAGEDGERAPLAIGRCVHGYCVLKQIVYN